MVAALHVQQCVCWSPPPCGSNAHKLGRCTALFVLAEGVTGVPRTVRGHGGTAGAAALTIVCPCCMNVAVWVQLPAGVRETEWAALA